MNARKAIDLMIVCVWGAIAWIAWRYVESGVIRNVLVGVSVVYVLGFSVGAYLDKDRRKLALSPGTSRLPVKTDHITELAFLSEEDTELMVWDLYGKVSMVIGRDVKENRVDVDLSGGPYASMVDMEHAVLNYSNGNWYVEDLGSVNGLGIQKAEDGRLYRLSPDTPCKLEQGDIICIGMNRLLIR